MSMSVHVSSLHTDSKETQAYVCCHSSHNHSYYGNGNLAEGGKEAHGEREREEWDSKKMREGMGRSTTRLQHTLLPSHGALLCPLSIQAPPLSFL